MAAPQPRGHNPQRQPLTVALRKICRDYPAGAGVLRELLQNADDAGASTVVCVPQCFSPLPHNTDEIQKFVLDTRSHPDAPVLADGLSEYQGPALLAYNDGLFSKDDFHSLTSLADSKKIQDKAATGKFGLGFSSVFNWTDSPSILSGSTLLFLDPHHSWSGGFPTPGGPEWGFPDLAMDDFMMNHLRCFSHFGTEWKQPFSGTIIRIPLRTASQAGRSQISNVQTTTSDIQNAMDTFAHEMGSSGLLFLRSVQRIVLSVNDERLNDIEVINGHDLTAPKQVLKNILARSFKKEDQIDGDHVYHEVRIRHWFPGGETVKMFGVLNLVADSIHDSLSEDWAESEKLFPWVAVAAPLKSQGSSDEVGRLFSTLPLPITTGLPVHIHGLFSISADRSRLHGLDDSGVQDHRPKEWNKFLFEQIIPRAWAKLLWNIRQSYPAENHFQLWPTNKADVHQLWYGLCRAVVNQISRDHLPVWFTDVGHVALEGGLLALEKTPLKEVTAFREAKLPVIFLAKHLFDEACQVTGSRILRPRTLYYECLKHLDNFANITRQSRLVLLEILLPEISLTELGALEVFPFHDGKFRSLKMPPLFLHRDGFEKNLFARQLEISIDADQLSANASRLLHERVRKDNQIVRYRTPKDVHDYFLAHIATGAGDTLLFDEDKLSTVEDIWIWISRYSKEQLPLSTLGSLWLIPLRGSAVRRLVPLETSNFVTWLPAGELKDLSLKLSDSRPGNALKILADGALSGEILPFLLSCAVREPSLRIKNGSKFGNFLEFLTQDRSLLVMAPDDLKDSVLRLLKKLSWSQDRSNHTAVCNSFKSLCLFRQIEWPANATDLSVSRHWTDMASDATFLGLNTLVPIPPSPNHSFLDVSDESERALFEEMGLLKCMNEVQILEEIVIPALRDGGYDRMNPSFRLHVANLLFQNYYRISPFARSILPSLKIVPLEKRKDDDSLKFGRPLDTLDPQKPALLSLYFEDEIRLPERQFYDQFSGVLANCGMVQCLDGRVVLDRVRRYGRGDLEVAMVTSQATNLLKMPFPEDCAQRADVAQVVRENKWLPARAPDKSHTMTIASECRDISDESLVGHVWHVLPFKVDENWRSILGWHQCIDASVLISHLDKSIGARDIHSVDQTLLYLNQHHLAEERKDHLLELDFVRSSEGKLVNAANVCRQGVERLMPYLHAVEPRFWDDHHEIMKLAKIPEIPGLEQLKDVQKALQAKEPLGDQDLDVAVELARIWGLRFQDVIDGLRLPSDNGVFVGIGDLVFNDTPGLWTGTRAIAHPKISRTLADQLKIEPLSELVRNGELGIADSEDDEFYQREEIADGIRDTLDRYTREHTFHEYLANADDCGSASEVNIFFDGTSYGTNCLIHKDLEGLQGPSLLIHNDGVFTESDFEGLKYVGRGSKREDATTIGKFGRGSQTMYHWTDVPMILSGEHLLILDPLRQHLPLNYHTGQKKPGIIVKYAKLKSACQDQLAPFEGLWGFESDRPYYNGTIFRFPLRSPGQSSELLESRLCPDISTTVQVFRQTFDEARLSLLFLRNIKTIDFSVKGGHDFEWRVGRGSWPEGSTFSDWANVIVEQHNDLGKKTTTMEQWWRVIEDVRDPPAELQHRHKRRMKNVECGIAALVPQIGKAAGSPLGPLKSRFFNCLPLKFESTLPVQIHATFLLSGDRQNIATEETSKDAGSEWNKWLLQKEIPHVYLQFLEDIGRKTGPDVYRYFPADVSGKQHVLSDLIRASFWENISSSTCRLFPIIEVFSDSKTPRVRRRGSRSAPNLATFDSAVFDVLEQRDSDALQPLIDGWLHPLVRPPVQLARCIRAVPGVKVLTPARIRELLRSDEAEMHIENARQRSKTFLDTLLSFIMPKTTAEVIELDGCPVLPLANGTLGKLCQKRTMNSKSGNDKMYFLADAECHGLFPFASSILASSRSYGIFVKKIVDFGLLNVKNLEKKDVNKMLECKESWSIESTPKTWLFQFWTYVNSITLSTTDSTEVVLPDLDSLQHFPLLLLRQQHGKEALNSLHYFQNNPVVVSSTVEEHMKLFMEFPGLEVVDSTTLPGSYCGAEGSLSDLGSLNRFLKSIEMLAVRYGASVTEFAMVCLQTEDQTKVLRESILRASNAVGDGSSLLDTANKLPLWPRVSSKPGYLTTDEALVAQNSAFVVPWIKNYHQFTRASALCRQVSIDDVGMLTRYVLPTLPECLDAEARTPYTRLINALAVSSSLWQRISKKNKGQRLAVYLNDYRLAARQDGKLCCATDLFDHNDTIYSAAFRNEATSRFLMLEVQRYYTLWNELGIRRRETGRFSGPDYLACLRALEGRLTGLRDEQLMTDIESVLNPLCTTYGTLDDLSGTTWTAIARLPVFPVRPVSGEELSHRRRRMEDLASAKPTLCLLDIVRREHAAVCWSQTPFALHEPTMFSIQKSGSPRRPTCTMVWQHLAFLAESAQSIEETEVQGFMEDLQKTYEYLHFNLQESKGQFTQPNAALWLNVETTSPGSISLDVLQSSWTSLEYLLLDSPCDAPPLMIVQPFLARFSTLLKELGCKSLHYPEVKPPTPGKSEVAFTLIRELWKEGVLTDVTFEAEGTSIPAHQIILASRSLYCRRQFSGPWASASAPIFTFTSTPSTATNTTTRKPIYLQDMTPTTLTTLISSCYHEPHHHDWARDFRPTSTDNLTQIADKLDALLDVLVAADRWLMPDLHADAQGQVMAGLKFFIRPDNVESVKRVADEANAVQLRDYCEEYRVVNAEAVLLANA